MFELWIDVIGGDDPDERIIAKGGLPEIDKAVAEFTAEVEGNSDKSFWLQVPELDEEYEFFSAEEYEEDVRPELEDYLARWLGKKLLMPH